MPMDADNASLERFLRQRDVLWDHVAWERGRLEVKPPLSTPHVSAGGAERL
jgi:hypothetical protein